MKRKITVNPKYHHLKSFIDALPERFEKEGTLVYEDRNIIKKYDVDGVQLNVKRYCIPRLISRLAYSTFSKTKSSRAYSYPFIILERGFESPEPVACIEEYACGVLGYSYFVSIQCDYKHEMRELGDADFEESKPLMTAFAQYTARLHKAGIMHKDYSPGNILFDVIDGVYHFSLIDTNRMNFAGDFSQQECCAAFKRLWGQTDKFRFMARVYAAERGWDADSCERMILEERKNFWDAYRRRGHTALYKIDI